MSNPPDEDPPACKQQDIPPFALTKKQWQLIHGNPTTKNPSSIRSDIREDKIQKLPARFAHLFEDVTTLAEEEVFAEGLGQKQLDYDNIFWEIINTDWASERYRTNSLTPHVLSEPARKNRQFGLELGRMAYYLCKDTRLADKQNILYGFFKGLLVDSIEPDGYAISSKQKKELKHNIELLEEEVATWSAIAGYSKNLSKTLNKNLTDPQRIIKEVLNEFDITPSDTAVSYIKSDVDISIPAIGNSDSKRQKEKGKIKNYVEEFAQYTNILQLEELYRTVESDLEELADEKRYGQDGETLIQQAVEIDGAFSSSDLDTEDSRGADYLLKKFAGREDHLVAGMVDSPRWVDRPLLTDAGNRWAPTMYAKLLVWIDSVKSKENTYAVDQFHRYILDKSKLSTDDEELIKEGLQMM